MNITRAAIIIQRHWRRWRPICSLCRNYESRCRCSPRPKWPGLPRRSCEVCGAWKGSPDADCPRCYRSPTPRRARTPPSPPRNPQLGISVRTDVMPERDDYLNVYLENKIDNELEFRDPKFQANNKELFVFYDVERK